MENYLFMKGENTSVTDFYNFFQHPGTDLKRLIAAVEDFSNFYLKEFGDIKPLGTQKFLEFYDLFSDEQILTVLHIIYRKPSKDNSLHKMYNKDLTLLKAFFNFITMWNWTDFRKIGENCFELKIAFERIYKENLLKNNLEGIHRSQIFNIFLNTSPASKASMLSMAMEKYSLNSGINNLSGITEYISKM